MEPREIIPELWHGRKAKTVRYYYYIRRGLDEFNGFRYIIMSVFALYYMFKLNNPLLIPLMFFICIPVLFMVGYVSVHHMKKITEYIGIQFSSHWARYSVDLQEERNRHLKAIRKHLIKIRRERL